MSEFNEMPLSSSPLSMNEAIRIESEITTLLRYLGSPGDWGYKTKLGQFIEALYCLRTEVRIAAKNAAVQDASDN